MDVKGAFKIFIILCWASFGWARMPWVHWDSYSSNVFDVVDHGAVGDGKTDDSKAFLKAWAKACSMSGSSTLKVPYGKTFLLNPVTFNGPCNSININFQILGDISAPSHISAWNGNNLEHWIVFHSIDGLNLNGTGQIDGQGSSWWKCRNDNICPGAPTSVKISHCNNFRLRGLKFINSPMMHLVLNNCLGVQISKIMITAPENSPNTDGIHLGNSKHVEIMDSVVGTGDDCISIGNGTSDVNITKIFCGPGHGISVGSLGRSESYAVVEQIYVSNCTFHGTSNGLRIKTWQGGSGFVRGVTFEKMKLTSVDNPIIIDQFYCNGLHNCRNKTMGVEVTDVKFVNVVGSSTKEVAINLACSETVACKDIHLEDIRLTTTEPYTKPTSFCSNAHGTMIPPVVPAVPCLA